MIGRNAPLPNVPDAAILQWANGKTLARPSATPAARFGPHVGFHMEAGRDAELDRLLLAAGLPRIAIKHQRPGGAEVVEHWDLSPTLHILPITAGPVASSVAASLSNGSAVATANAGIGLRWGRGAGERSRMAVRGFVRGLWDAGYRRPVQLATRSRMTDVLLVALLDHTRAAVETDRLIDRGRHPEPVSPAELWLPLGPGAEAEFGRADTATVTPFVSGHPAALTPEYLRTIWAGPAVYAAASAAWPLVQAWAMDYAAHGGEETDAPPADEPAA